MKKILVMGLAAVMALGARAVGWETESRDSGCAITGVTGASGDVTIPSSIGGQPVVEIGFGAFAFCEELTVLRIPASVTYVDEMAFAFCDALTDIYFAGDCPDSPGDVGLYGDTIIHVGETAKGWGDTWCFCTVIHGEPPDPPQPTSPLTIVDGVVTKCDTSATGAVEIPSEFDGQPVTSIGNYAFQGCTGIKLIRIPSSVQAIGSYAFYNCHNLTSINIPDGIKIIKESLFGGCSNLVSLTLSDSIETIEQYAFADMPMTEMVMPKSITNVYFRMFVNCANLKAVYFPGARKPATHNDTGESNSSIFGANVPADCTVYVPVGCGWENDDGTRPTTVWDRPLVFAESETWVLDGSQVHRLTEDRVILASLGKSAVCVAPGATAFLEIPEGLTLMVFGGKASGQSGAGAGIEVPENSRLFIFGGGQLVAIGGDAAAGGDGQRGGDAEFNTRSFLHIAGSGGASGRGGGGAGAGIGGRGGSGGDAVVTFPLPEWRLSEGTGFAADGVSGARGKDGLEGTSCGTVYLQGSLKVIASSGYAGGLGKVFGYGTETEELAVDHWFEVAAAMAAPVFSKTENFMFRTPQPSWLCLLPLPAPDQYGFPENV